MDVTTVASLEKNNVAEPMKAFGLWMLVEWKYQRNPRTRQNLDKKTTENDVVIPNRIKTTEERAAMANEKGLNFFEVSFHFNLTFNDLVESMMELNSEVSNPRKHSAIVFKEIEVSNIVKPNGQVDSTERGKGISPSKGIGSRFKSGIGRSNGAISKIIRGRGRCFKNSSNIRVPLSDTINSMAKLISSQIDIEAKKHCIFVIFIYVSPDSRKWRRLWDALKATIPNNGSSWVAVGDFNTFSFQQKEGWMEFMKGLAELLGMMRDLCLSQTTHLSRLKSNHNPLILSLRPILYSVIGRPFLFSSGIG
ncbi:hypothetical protein PVK06_019175 [Gossypium arboreum]|uniref:Uncharacterized protein n=1 Tax=Gossypium arboreum TaxID=29729 RepID=A0ABR0PJ62_GOSAR|nr:hypothetical protein PVK06_019175 [Gossypium arboreum]